MTIGEIKQTIEADVAGLRAATFPSQTGQSGKVLSTDGTDVSWISQSGGSGVAYRNIKDAYTEGMRTTNTAAQNTTILQGVIDALSTAGGGKIYGAEMYPCNKFILKNGVSITFSNTTAFKGSSPINGGTPAPGAIPKGGGFIITDTSGPFITYESNTSIDGVIFYYPNQAYTATSSSSLITYPTTISKAAGIISCISFTRLTFIGCTTGITGIGTSSDYMFDMYINLIYGYPLSGVLIDLRYVLDIPRIENCHFNPGVGVLTVGSRGGSTYQIAHTPEIIDYVVANSGAVYNIDNTDEFQLRGCFVFGAKTGFKITNSYGQMTNCNADMVETGAYISINTSVKYVYMAGFSCIPSAGPTPSNRNAVVFEGTGGKLYIDSLNAFLGTNGAVPSSSSPSAGAVLKVSGSGNQVARISKWGLDAYSGTWGYSNVNKVNNSSVVEFSLPAAGDVSGGGSGGGSSFLDNFNGSASNLSGHTADSSQVWTNVQPVGSNPSNGLFLSGTGTVYSAAPTGAQTIYKTGFSPSTANQQYSLSYDIKTNVGDFGMFARFSNTSDLDFTGYGARYSPGAGGIQLYKVINGNYTQLGSTYSYTMTSGDIVTLAPTGTSIVVKLNGTAIITVTDSSITGAGTVALWGDDGAGSPTTGVHVSKLETI